MPPNSARVNTVIWPAEWILSGAKFAVVPSLALTVGIVAAGPPALSSSSSLADIVFKFIGPIVALVSVAVVKWTALNSGLDRATARLHRRIANACNHDHPAGHDGGGLACHLTPDIFQFPAFNYKKQSNLIENIVEACRGEKSGEYWFVQGKSGTGKTRTGLRMIQRLLRDPKLFTLGTRCYLYDLSDSPTVQEMLLRDIKAGSHDNAIVLIDNFQVVGAKLLDTLTGKLTRGSAPGNERLILFLAREAEAWNISPGCDVRLLSEAKEGDRYCELLGAASGDVVDEVVKIDGQAARLIAGLTEPGLASATQLHLAQIIVRNRSPQPEAMDVLRMLAGEASSVDPDSVRMLALLAATAMHRGVFSRWSVWRAIRAVTGGTFTREARRMNRKFRKFHRVGLVPKIRTWGTRYLFHEGIASQCIDGLMRDERFAESFDLVGRARLERLNATDADALRIWLIAAELGEQRTLESTFEAAMRLGAYGRMADCLQRANKRKRYELNETSRAQLAVLLDRKGDFSESRDLFPTEAVQTLDGLSDLAIFFATSRLEINHQHAYQGDLALLCKHPDPLVRLVGEYWETHIDAHRGVFAPDRLLALTTEAYRLLDGRHAYWQLHAIVRMYFDSLRHLYLVGENDSAKFVRTGDWKLTEYLEQMPTYKALKTLYTKAHLVGHVFIPRLMIFGKGISDDDAANVGIADSGVATADDLIAAAQRLYRQARDEFWMYGDREEKYLRAETTNAAMIARSADPEAIKKSLGKYEQFIVQGQQIMLASYPHLYRFRWELMTCFSSCLGPIESKPEGADYRLESAARRLQKVIVLDFEAGNLYGQKRAELLSILLSMALDCNVAEPELSVDGNGLTHLGRLLQAHHYGFEQRLVSHLLERQVISWSELGNIFRFYPFVNQ
jgi:hypothetical protein